MAAVSIGFGPLGPAEGVVTGTYTGGGADPSNPIFYGDLVIATVTTGSVVVMDPITGASTAEVNLSWSVPSVGQDAALLNYVGRYWVSYRSDESSFTPEASTIETSMLLTGLPVGLPIVVRIRAQTNAGAFGPFHSAALITAFDTTPPPQPSEPQLVGTLRGVQATWDGLFSGGETRPSDFNYVRVEYSQTVGFEIVIKGGQLTTAGTSPATLAFGTGSFRAYCRFVAVDRSGNNSPPSAVTYIDSAKILTTDITDGAIETRLLAEHAVTAFNVTDFALTVRKFNNNQHLLY